MPFFIFPHHKQVMYSPMLASSGCQIFAYNLIERSALPDGVGSVFQTLQYSLPSPSTDLTSTPILRENKKPSIVSGHATLRRPGQFSSRRSNSPEEIIGTIPFQSQPLNLLCIQSNVVSVRCTDLKSDLIKLMINEPKINPNSFNLPNSWSRKNRTIRCPNCHWHSSFRYLI